MTAAPKSPNPAAPVGAKGSAMEAILECGNFGHAVAAHGDDGCHEDSTCKLTQAQVAETVANVIEQYEKKLSSEG